MRKIIKHLSALICLMAGLALPFLVSAGSSATNNLKFVGEQGNAPYVAANEYKLSEIIGTAIQSFLGLLGIIFLVYMLYAGYNWMTAEGDEEKVTKAKDTIQRAIIGLIITIGAYAISYWVFDKLLTGTGIVS